MYVASGLTEGFIVALGVGMGVDVTSGVTGGLIVALGVGVGVDVVSGLTSSFIVALGVGLGVAVSSARGKQASKRGAATTVPPKATAARRNPRLVI